MKFGFIWMRLKDGTIKIIGGRGLSVDVEEGNLVFKNTEIQIELKPPVTKEELHDILKDVRYRFGKDAARELATILKSIPELGYSD